MKTGAKGGIIFLSLASSIISSRCFAQDTQYVTGASRYIVYPVTCNADEATFFNYSTTLCLKKQAIKDDATIRLLADQLSEEKNKVTILEKNVKILSDIADALAKRLENIENKQ